MPKDTKTLGNNKTQACESLGFAHKKRGYVCFDTPSLYFLILSNSQTSSSNTLLILDFSKARQSKQNSRIRQKNYVLLFGIEIQQTLAKLMPYNQMR